MIALQPFETHNADVDSLQTCGGSLIDQAAEGLTNGKLTKGAYEPAVDNVRGTCAPQVTAAERSVQERSANVSAELAWAAVVSRYWGTQISGFNTRVEEIKQDAWEDIARDDDDHDGAKREIRQHARRDWWRAHSMYIEDGRTRAKAMLRDGPTAGHVRAAIEAGAMPPMTFDYDANDAWASFKGIFTPPTDRGGVAVATWGVKGLTMMTSWGGHAHNTFADYRYQRAPRPTMSFSQWSRRSVGYLNRSNWHPYDHGRYRWTRNSLTFRGRYTPQTTWGTVARYADKGFYAADFAYGAYDQWTRDANRTDLTTGAKATRSLTRATVETAGTYVGIEAGAKLGATIGSFTGTPVGTVVGGMIGGVVGGVIGSGLADEAADFAVEGATEAYDWTADRAEEVGEAASAAIDEAGDAVEDVGDALKFW